jgi:hypothetical protein
MMRRTIGPTSDGTRVALRARSLEMLRISSDKTGQARFARVSIGGGQWVAVRLIVVAGAAEPRLGRGVTQR